jgi:hypothetical protein
LGARLGFSGPRDGIVFSLAFLAAAVLDYLVFGRQRRLTGN